MNARIASKLGSVAGILLVITVLLGCSSSVDKVKESRDSIDRQAMALRSIHWKVNGEPHGRVLHISSDVGYCDGSPVPRIKRVRIEEHARKALLTAMLTSPVRSADVACAGVRLGVSKTVTLKQGVAGRVIYDASFSPPKRRWPR